jgi:hypothetical protein
VPYELCASGGDARYPAGMNRAALLSLSLGMTEHQSHRWARTSDLRLVEAV